MPIEIFLEFISGIGRSAQHLYQPKPIVQARKIVNSSESSFTSCRWPSHDETGSIFIIEMIVGGYS